MEKYYVKYRIWSNGSSVVQHEETITNQPGRGLLGIMEDIKKLQGKSGCQVDFLEAKVIF